MKDDMLWELRTGKAFREKQYIPRNLPGFGQNNSSILDLLPWYCNEEKLRIEIDAVKRSFINRFDLKWTRFGEPYWEGFLQTLTISSMIRVYYPCDMRLYPLLRYPVLPAKAFPIPPIFKSPHIFPDMSMCLFDPKDTVNMSWNPLTDTAADIIKWADMWLFKQGYWEETGRWVGPQGHGGSDVPIYLNHLLEDKRRRR